MVCNTNKPDKECKFMSKSGCKYKDGACKPIVEQCEGCERIEEFNGVKYCMVFPEPSKKWKNGLCNFATHKKPEFVEASKRVNPLKASKRAAAGRR